MQIGVKTNCCRLKGVNDDWFEACKVIRCEELIDVCLLTSLEFASSSYESNISRFLFMRFCT